MTFKVLLSSYLAGNHNEITEQLVRTLCNDNVIREGSVLKCECSKDKVALIEYLASREILYIKKEPTRNVFTFNIREENADYIDKGVKTYDVKSRDNDIKVGDYVRYKVYDEAGNLKNHPLSTKMFEVTYVSNNWSTGVKDGFYVFSIKECE